MTTYPKRLVEVDLPIKRISAHARREKSIRHGHISTLHIWWARRPLAACRAVLCAALWPDPADEHCPQAFRDRAAELLTAFAKRASQIGGDAKELSGIINQEASGRWNALSSGKVALDTKDEASLSVMRGLLLDFIADFASWEASTCKPFLKTARALTQAAHEALGGAPGTKPLVVDPFAGGGAIPLEALRVGADAFASDLNPVAVLLNKVVLEYIPKYGQTLADEVRKWGAWVKEEAEKELAEFYPKDPDLPAPRPGTFWIYVLKCGDERFYIGQTDSIPRRWEEHWSGEVSWTKSRLPVELIHYESFSSREEAVKREKELKTGFGRKWLKREYEKGRLAARQAGGATPIAYLWARTITCEGPGCGAEVPLMRSLWLSKKKTNAHALKLVPNPEQKRVDFEIMEKPKAKDVAGGTVARGSATCPCCGYTTPVTSTRRQLKERRGGAADARLFCVVTTRPNERGRFYRLPEKRDLNAAKKAAEELERRKASHDGPLSLVPDEPTPQGGGSGAGRAFSQRNYGMDYFEDLFTPRQALALTTLARLVREAGAKLAKDCDAGLAEAVQTILTMSIGKQADLGCALCAWEPLAQCPRHLFGRQAIGMVWDFAEGVPIGDSSGAFSVFLTNTQNTLEGIGFSWHEGKVEQADAARHPLPDEMVSCMFTDPPYYDAVPYADLSDFFYVWLKRSLPDSLTTTMFYNDLVPKDEECVVDEVKGHDRDFFEKTMKQAMEEGRRVVNASGVGVVVFAHKSTAGWETSLQAMIDAGWVMTGSWPVDTECGSRLRAMNSAALASSVHLICRPRENPDGSLRTDDVGDWRDVIGELPKRIHEWMPRLQQEGVVGADAIFACLGPALEVFSRYSRVERANGEIVTLREYLEQVWAAVSREALNMIFQGADATGFEEDARLTAMWLWTLAAPGSEIAKQAEGDDDDLPARGAQAGSDDDEEAKAGAKVAAGGFTLEYDAARKIAQGLGAHLEELGNLVEVSGDKARLLPVAERTKALFGKDADAATGKKKKKKKDAAQGRLFADLAEAEVDEESQWSVGGADAMGATVLDRVHQAMILFAAGRSAALQRFVVDDGAGKDERFWRLAQAFSALYPAGSEEKRWVDGVLARKKGFGF